MSEAEFAERCPASQIAADDVDGAICDSEGCCDYDDIDCCCVSHGGGNPHRLSYGSIVWVGHTQQHVVHPELQWSECAVCVVL